MRVDDPRGLQALEFALVRDGRFDLAALADLVDNVSTAPVVAMGSSSSAKWRASRPDSGKLDGEMTSSEGEHPVFRVGGISYLRIPATDPRASARFYEAVFGWHVRSDRDEPAFEDGTGHVIGHFMRSQSVAGEAGVRPYIYVERVDETLDAARDQGAELVEPPYPEGDLWVATFRDPAGNVVGVWQTGPRDS